MTRPTIGTPDWGDELNADLDGIELLAQTALDTALAADGAYADTHRVYSAPGAAEGYDTLIDLAHNSADPEQPESFMVRVWSTAVGSLKKCFWLNESGLPRSWAVRKQEPAMKFHAYVDLNDAPVIEVRGPWDDGAIRRWGVSSKGAPLLGPDQIIGANVIVLAAAASLPANLPAGTVVVRV